MQAKAWLVQRIEEAQAKALNDPLLCVQSAARELIAYYSNAATSRNAVEKKWAFEYNDARVAYEKARAATEATAAAAAAAAASVFTPSAANVGDNDERPVMPAFILPSRSPKPVRTYMPSVNVQTSGHFARPLLTPRAYLQASPTRESNTSSSDDDESSDDYSMEGETNEEEKEGEEGKPPEAVTTTEPHYPVTSVSVDVNSKTSRASSLRKGRKVGKTGLVLPHNVVSLSKLKEADATWRYVYPMGVIDLVPSAITRFQATGKVRVCRRCRLSYVRVALCS